MLAMVRKMASLIALLALLCPALLFSAGAVSSENPVGDSWAAKAPMQKARIGLGAAAVNGKIYAIGGLGDITGIGYSSLAVNEEYDPATDTWTYKTPMPTPRYAFAIAVYKNKIYCIGGKAGGFSATGVNEVYDPATDTWRTLQPMPTARMQLQANVVDGKIYLMGGRVSDQSYRNDTVFSLNEAYDPLTNIWTTKASMPQAIAVYASAVVNNKIYVINQTLNMIYDAQNDSWSQGAPPHIKYIAIGGATTGILAPQRIYVFSGSKAQNYDPRTNSWTDSASIPKERYFAGIAVLDDRFYVIGGWTYEHTKYGPSVNEFQQVYTGANEVYTPIGYGAAPPEIMILSPENNMSYNSSSFSLNFTVNKPTNWSCYSLDGEENVSITGNTTIADLSNGVHNVTVYANDTLGNSGASETIAFTINQPALFPTVEIATIATIMIAIIVFVAVYLKRRKPTVV